MSTEYEWPLLIGELERLINDNDYKVVRGGLEKLLNLANARIAGQEGKEVVSPEQIRADLENIKRINWEIKGDANPLEVFSKAIPETSASGQQPEERTTYSASGDVLKAEGNVFKAGNNLTTADNVFNAPVFNASVFYMDSYKDAKGELDKILLEVVLFVMTDEEAKQLNSEEVFASYNNPIYFRQFGELQKKLTEEQIQDALERYGPTSEDWRPFKDVEDNISKLVQDALKLIRDFKKPIVPHFVDIRSLTDEKSEKTNRLTLKLLRDEGCIVITDVISMQHPVIQRAYRRSFLDVYSHIPVIRIAPTDRVLRFEQQMINFFERQLDLEIMKRLDWDADDSCREVSRDSGLKSWVRGQVPGILKRREDSKRTQDNVQSSYKDLNGAA